MKKLTIFASALLFTSAAYAQGPTNTYTGQAVRGVAAPANPNAANAPVAGASAGSYNTSYNAYSQDSYINQAGSNNTATVDQSDARTPGIGGGSTAIADQTGNNNTATQTQTSSNTPYSNYAYSGNDFSGARDYAKTTQAGNGNQSNQTQNGGVYNRMTVTQGVGTTGNRAIQTQNIDAAGGGAGNQAIINQTQYNSTGGSGNRAEQTQSGILETGQIDQQSTNSFAKQTQSGGQVGAGNSANIQQGAPGVGNTAQQTQNGQNNAARISQSVGVGNAGNTNYALQNQTMIGNQADIIQRSSNNYAEQQQSGLAGGGHNYSIMTQSGGPSAALSVQTGNSNSAFVTQH